MTVFRWIARHFEPVAYCVAAGLALALASVVPLAWK